MGHTTASSSYDPIRALSFGIVAINFIDLILGLPISHILVVAFSAAIGHILYHWKLVSGRETLFLSLSIAFPTLCFHLLLGPSISIFLADALLVCHYLYQTGLNQLPMAELGSAMALDYLVSCGFRYFPSAIGRLIISLSLSLSLLSMTCLFLGRGYNIAKYYRQHQRQSVNVARPRLDYAKSAPVRFADKPLHKPRSRELLPDAWTPAKTRLETGGLFLKHTKGSARSRFVKLNPVSACLEWWMPDRSALVGQTPFAALQAVDRDGATLSIKFVTRTLVLQAATSTLAIQWQQDLGLLRQHKLAPLSG